MSHPVKQSSETRSGEPRKPVSWGESILAYLERMWLLFCLYTLSIGPMYWEWLSGREAKGSLLIAAFYEPLRRLGSAFPLFGEWLNWYVRLWIF